MFQTVGQPRALSFCAALLLAACATLAGGGMPASRPAHATRLDLLYLHARLLTSDADLPDAARSVLDDAARQKTWAASPTPVALLDPAQVETLLTAFASRPGDAVTPGVSKMLFPNRRVKTASVVSPATRPADQPRFEIRTTAGTVDDQGTLPLDLSVTVTLPARGDEKKGAAAPRALSAKIAVATPVERTLLVDLLPSSHAPRAFLLIRPSAHAVDRKDPAAAMQVAGDLFRAWDRVWPLFPQLVASVQGKQYADARRQTAQLRDLLRPALDAAEGTDYAADAAAIAEQLDATATALRRFESDRAIQSFRAFQRVGDRLHDRLTRLMLDSGRLPPAPATRPR